MSSLANRILSLLWPWKTGAGAGLYQLVLQPGISLLSRENPGRASAELGLTLVARPGYLAKAVEQTYQSMKFLHGGRLPLRVKVISQDLSQSLRYGLTRAHHLIRINGEKRFIDEFSTRLKETILRDQREARLDAPQVTAQNPENWLLTSSVAPASTMSVPTGENSWLKPLGIAGLMLGLVAGLAWLSESRTPIDTDHLQAAISHLRTRGSGELQLLDRERVEGGEKFYFQGPTENYTVVVDKDGHVYSWSRAPSSKEGASLA